MKTVLLTNKYDGVPLAILEQAIAGRFELRMLDEVTQEDLEKKVHEADYLLVSGRLKVTRELLAKAKNLKMIQRTGVGLDNIDFDAVKEYGIPFYVNFGVNSISVAEHAVMLILAVMRRICAVDAQIRKGVWKKQATGLSTHQLYGKTVGVIGMGNIGKHVAEILRGFGVRILYFDQYRLKPEEEEKYGVTYCLKEEVLKESDVVTLHCSLDPKGGYVIGKEELGMMKDGAILINTARGKLVDTKALKEALENGHLAGAGIDTYEEEPVKPDNPLLTLPNTTLSPHIGGLSYESFSRMMELAMQNVCAFDCGQKEMIENNRIKFVEGKNR
ncbi:MAG: phosphoglycerate dehydrogenase [Erysipelotrichales bacterium]|nr:phosphoglycerate dehydrogenase [Erysipelotrichales bacterium]MBQ1505562.1 phosphoglycerate dehydrogenase [Erysipelotrichales bacterium]